MGGPARSGFIGVGIGLEMCDPRNIYGPQVAVSYSGRALMRLSRRSEQFIAARA